MILLSSQKRLIVVNHKLADTKVHLDFETTKPFLYKKNILLHSPCISRYFKFILFENCSYQLWNIMHALSVIFMKKLCFCFLKKMHLKSFLKINFEFITWLHLKILQWNAWCVSWWTRCQKGSGWIVKSPEVFKCCC